MPDLLIEKKGRVTILTLNRSEKRNALGGTIPDDFVAAMAEFDADDDQYVAIITGAGDEVFCSGADLSILSVTGEGILPMVREPDLFGIARSDKPVIAAVNGAAIGGGFELAMLCDVRLASENAYFALPEVNWGFVPGIAVNFLPRLLPLGVTMDLFLFAQRLPVGDAHRLGLVQQVVPQGQLLEAALCKAERIEMSSQATVRATKQLLKRDRDLDAAERHRQYEAVMEGVFQTGDAEEGLRAFRERRAPQFQNSQTTE